MAKFFKKVRQKFITEGRLKKYLIYAIGEIVLVVIGILVALQVNTMNQNWKRAKLERVLLGQVKFEILEIYEDIWRDAGNLQLGVRSHHHIKQYMVQDKPYVDSLCFDFHWINQDEYIYPTSAAFTKLKEVGLDVIKNDSIRVGLQALYEGHFPRLTKNNAYRPDISKVFNDYYLNSFKPNSDLTLQFNFHLPDDTVGTRIYSDVYYQYPQKGEQNTIGYVPLDFEALKKDSKFQMLLEQTRNYRNLKLRRYSYVKLQIKDLIKRIEEELEKSK